MTVVWHLFGVLENYPNASWRDCAVPHEIMIFEEGVEHFKQNLPPFPMIYHIHEIIRIHFAEMK